MAYTNLTKEELLRQVNDLEQEILEIQESKDATFKQAAIGIAHVSQKGEFIRVNKIFAQMFGYDAESMLRLTVKDISHPGGVIDSSPEVQKVWSGEIEQFSIEKRYVRKDKSVFWGNLTISHYKSPKEDAEYNIAVLQDASDKKQAIDDIIKEREFTDYLIKNIPAQFFICSIKGDEFRLVRWNNILEELTEYSPEELLNKNIFDFYSEQDYPVLIEAINELIKTGSNSIDLFATMKSGKRIPFHYEGFLFSEDDKNYYMGIGFDISEQLEAKELLRKNEEKYSAVVENSNDAIAIHNKGRIVYINRAAEKELGFSNKELIGKDILEIIAPEYRDAVIQRNRARITGQEAPAITEIEFLRKDGTRVPVETNSSVIEYEGEKSMVVFIRNISKRKIAENKLKESEERFRLLSNLTKEGVVIHQDGYVLEVNKAFCDIFGYKIDEIIGTNPMTKIFSPENVQKLSESFKSEITPPRELEGIKKDGLIITILVDGKKMIYKNESVRVGTIRDITQQKEIEEELRIKEKAIESSINAIAMADLDGDLLYINKAGVDFWGYSTKEEVLGRSISEFWQRDHINSQLRDLKEKGFSINEGIGIKKDGSLIHIQYSVHLVKDEYSKPQYIFGSFIDITEKRKAEIALREAEERFSKAFFNIPDPIFFTTIPEGKFIDINPMFEKLSGYNRSELIGKEVTDFEFYTNKTDRKKLSEEIKNKGRLAGYELSFKNIKGEIRSCLIYTERIDLQGEQCLISILRDVTEQKQSEEELQKYREHLEELVKNRTAELEESHKENIKLSKAIEQSYATVVITNKEGNIEYVNENFTRTTGYSFEEVKNQNPRILKSDEMQDSHYKEMWETIVAGKIWKGEFINKKKNGEIYWESAIISPLLNQKEEITHFVAVKEDITERKQVEEELRQFKLFADTSIEGFGMAELDTQILYQNKRLCDLCGIDKAKMNESFLQFYPKKAKKKLREIVIPSAIKEGHWRGELDHLKAGGGTFPTIHNFFVIKDEKGNSVRLATTITDITERKQIESELKKSIKMAEDANRAKSTFLSNMSHEIRTPMNAILGFSELLSRRIKDQSQLNYLSSIQNSGKTLLQLINDILDFSKIESGKLDFSNEPTNIQDLVQDTINMLKVRSDEKDLHLHTVISKDLPSSINIDELRIKQILINLINNAIKFTEKGIIEVETRCQNKTNKYLDLIIRVKDTGMGISVENHQKIFRAFDQIEGLDSKRFEGTGLGLAITKHLVTIMDGTIELESEVGKGSIFTVILNNVKYSEGDVESEENIDFDLDSILFEESTVLVVDDIKTNRDVLKGYMSGYKINVIEAENGEEALIAIEKYKPDMVFLDLRMPVMDGYETNEIILKNPEWSKIPIIAITASAFDKDEEKIIGLGFNGYIRKPASLSEILSCLMKHLNYSAEVKKEDLTERVSIESIDKLEEVLLEIDKQIIPVLEEIKVVWNKKNILELAGLMIEIGDRYNATNLINYGKEIQVARESFNINRERKLIKGLSVFLNNLKSTTHGK